MIVALAYTFIFTINSLTNELVQNTKRLRGAAFVMLMIGSFGAICALDTYDMGTYVSIMALITALAFTLCDRKVESSLLVIPLIAIINDPTVILMILFIGFNVSRGVSRSVLNLLLLALVFCFISTIGVELIFLRLPALGLLIIALIRMYFETDFIATPRLASTFPLLTIGITIAKLFLLFSFEEFAPLLMIFYLLPLIIQKSLGRSTYINIARVICISSVMFGYIPFNIALSIYLFLEISDIIFQNRLPEGLLQVSSYAVKLNALLLLLFVFLTAYLLRVDTYTMISFIIISFLLIKHIVGLTATISRFHILNAIQFVIIIYVGYLQWS